MYIATKAALKAMVEAACMELADRGITINSIMPSLTETPPVVKNTSPESVAFKASIVQKSAAKRLGTPQDIAETIVFLCSKNSRWVNGQHIVLNGGGCC